MSHVTLPLDCDLFISVVGPKSISQTACVFKLSEVPNVYIYIYYSV
jgi:hypothetical protein